MKKFYSTFLFVFICLFTFQLHAYQAAVVSAHPSASKIGKNILEKGGNAIDAAIAMGFALGVVEPYNSGIGGGGFLLYYEAEKKKFHFLDYRETAPQKINKHKDNNQIFKNGLMTIGVPGFLKGMEEAHQKWGSVSWKDLINPSYEIAAEKMVVEGQLAKKLAVNQTKLLKDPDLNRIFVEPLEQGEDKPLIHQKELAQSLKTIMEEGAHAFYAGSIGQKLTDWMKEIGGLITPEDLQNYQAHLRKPFHFQYGPFQITSAPIPSSGGMGLSLFLKKSIVYRIHRQKPYTLESYQRFIQSAKDYFEYREKALGDSPYNIIKNTTHYNVIDSKGNMVAVTNTLNHHFGSGLSIPGTGIILNDELRDFSTKTNTANIIKGGHRPLSSMAPTIIFKDKEPYLILGTPGGLTIPQNLFQIIFTHWYWNEPLSRAISRGKIYYNPHSEMLLVEENFSKKILSELDKTHKVKVIESIGNAQLIHVINQKKTRTYTDPRGDGKGYQF